MITALEISFGKIELDYDQLSEHRNSMRQGLKMMIEKLLDDYRESLRYMEEKSDIKKFIRSFRSEIEIRLLTNQPRTLREAFSERR